MMHIALGPPDWVTEIALDVLWPLHGEGEK